MDEKFSSPVYRFPGVKLMKQGYVFLVALLHANKRLLSVHAKQQRKGHAEIRCQVHTDFDIVIRPMANSLVLIDESKEMVFVGEPISSD